MGHEEVVPETKKVLASVPALDMRTAEGTTPLSICLLRLATSLAQAYQGERSNLDFPHAPLPLEWPAVPAPAL